MNEKDIIKWLLDNDHWKLKEHQEEIIRIVRKMFRKMGTEIKSGETILIKNFGSFKIKSRLPRRRYDQGMKKTVITAPKDIIQFTQSPNVFRYVIKKDEEEN